MVRFFKGLVGAGLAVVLANFFLAILVAKTLFWDPAAVALGGPIFALLSLVLVIPYLIIEQKEHLSRDLRHLIFWVPWLLSAILYVCAMFSIRSGGDGIAKEIYNFTFLFFSGGTASSYLFCLLFSHSPPNPNLPLPPPFPTNTDTTRS